MDWREGKCRGSARRARGRAVACPYISPAVKDSSMMNRNQTSRRNFLLRAAAVPAALATPVSGASAAKLDNPQLLSVERIWDRGAYNSFTDLIRFRDRWYCTFREGTTHGADNGSVRVIVSDDASGDALRWESTGFVTEAGTDLRDPKLSLMPDGRLMLIMGGSKSEFGRYWTRSPRVSFSTDGARWTTPRRVLAEDHWLWRVTWHKGIGYCLSKLNEGRRTRRGFLYTTTDGLEWDYVTEFMAAGVSETTLRFMPDDEMIALVRPGWIGRSRPPYKWWQFHKMKYQIGGPNFIRLPDGGLWASARRYHDDGATTVLARMTPESYEPVLTLPSGGDTSYPGMVWHDNLLCSSELRPFALESSTAEFRSCIRPD